MAEISARVGAPRRPSTATSTRKKPCSSRCCSGPCSLSSS
ncbi:hypothetical protein ACFSUI_18510 [Ralstonia solanacearum]